MPDRPTLERDLAAQMDLVSRAWKSLADRILASLGISNSAGWALVRLRRLGAGARQSELARELGIAEASLVRTVQQLERSGLVEREPDIQDRRANSLKLTPQGEALARPIDTRLKQLRAELTAAVSDEELANALDVIGRVATAIQEKRTRL